MKSTRMNVEVGCVLTGALLIATSIVVAVLPLPLAMQESLLFLFLVTGGLLIFVGAVISAAGRRRPRRLLAGKCRKCNRSVLGMSGATCTCGYTFTDDEIRELWAGHSNRLFQTKYGRLGKGTIRAAAIWRGLCPGCQYPLGGLGNARCPECGEAFDEQDVAMAWEGYYSRTPGAQPEQPTDV